MKRLKSLCVAGVIALAAVSSFADPAEGVKSLTARSFQFRFRDAEKAAAAVKSLLSEQGSLSIQPSSNTLVVTDRPENLKEIAAALAKFDAPAQGIHIKVRLVSAARAEASAARVPEGLKDIAPKLAVLRYNSLEELGDISADGKEGDAGLIDLPSSGYRAEFKFGDYDAVSNSVRVSDFRLSRLQGPQREFTQLLKTSLNLKIGQTVILGAARLPESQRALMIVVSATRTQ
jgi:Bacterial type II/III secretion system short domain